MKYYNISLYRPFFRKWLQLGDTRSNQKICFACQECFSQSAARAYELTWCDHGTQVPHWWTTWQQLMRIKGRFIHLLNPPGRVCWLEIITWGLQVFHQLHNKHVRDSLAVSEITHSLMPSMISSGNLIVLGSASGVYGNYWNVHLASPSHAPYKQFETLVV